MKVEPKLKGADKDRMDADAALNAMEKKIKEATEADPENEGNDAVNDLLKMVKRVDELMKLTNKQDDIFFQQAMPLVEAKKTPQSIDSIVKAQYEINQALFLLNQALTTIRDSTEKASDPLSESALLECGFCITSAQTCVWEGMACIGDIRNRLWDALKEGKKDGQAE